MSLSNISDERKSQVEEDCSKRKRMSEKSWRTIEEEEMIEEYNSMELTENLETEKNVRIEDSETKKGFFEFKTPLIWTNIIAIILVHILAVYCALTFDYLREWRTLLWMYVTYILSGLGVTGGAHRLWTHRSYKARTPAKLLLLFCYAMAAQNRMYDWVRDHRVHHRYSDTDADPHNSSRGFFFSHVGWLMMKKHPKVLEKGREVDMTDIKNEKFIVLTDKYFTILKIVCSFVIPTLIPVYFWNETWSRAIISQFIRYVIVLNCTWSVNSAAHIWGMKPYNTSIRPAENILVASLAGGEGWHNYHHVFPWDYKASEYGAGVTNITTGFIHLFKALGWAYDLKQPSPDLVKSIANQKGDGSYIVH